jgi:excisionase family DNA binding protein
MAKTKQQFYSLQQVAELLGCSSATVDSMRYSGALPTVKIGPLIRVPASALEEMGVA